MGKGKQQDVALLLLRLGIGLIAMYFGSQKMFGAFGGPGIHNTVGFMHDQMGIPPVFAILAMVAEFFGGLGMVVGFFTQIAAFGFACTMAVATYENWKAPGLMHALFSKPSPEDPAKAFFTIALLVGALAILIQGGGLFAIDSKLFGRRKKGKSGG